MFDKKDKMTILEKIPDISSDPVFMAIAAKISSFQDLLKVKKKVLDGIRISPDESYRGATSDSQTDAEQLISGIDVEVLEGPRKHDRREAILRQISALEKAILGLENQKIKSMRAVVKNACDNLPDGVKKAFRNILLAASDLESAITAAMEIEEVLRSRGYEEARRPEQYKVGKYFLDLHTGGGTLPALSWILENQGKLFKNGTDGKQ